MKGKRMKRIVWMSIVMICLMIGQAYAMDISRIEVNQALGYQKDNRLNFVAGKDTVIRAFLSEAVVVNAAQTWAKVNKDGTQVVQLEPKSSEGAVNVVDFLCPSREACGNWAAGTYTFEVSVNNAVKKEPADGSSNSYVFKARRPLNVLAVAIKGNFGGTVKTVDGDKWKTMWKFMASVYPTSIRWEVRNELDISGIDLNTESGLNSAMEALSNMNPTHCSANKNAEGCYNAIVGFLPELLYPGTDKRLQGLSNGIINLVVAGDEDAPATIAHEIGHTFGLGDTYDDPMSSLKCSVNPAPDGFKGRDMDTGEPTSCKAGRVALEGTSSALIPAEQHPYETDGRGALGNMGCYMGSGGRMAQWWTTQDAYDHLFNQFAPISDASRSRRNSPQRLIEYYGYISKQNAVKLAPWHTFESTETVTDSQGKYMIVALDNKGAIVATSALDVKFYILTNPPREIDTAPFEGAIRFPEGTVKFQIRNGSAILKEIAVSANAPTVTLTDAPTNPDSKYTIRWLGSDKDGDKLSYTVEYNQDASNPNSEWMVLASDIEQTQWEEDFSKLPGGSHARIRITVSDGILTGYAESAEFTVPIKAPEVFIYDPEWGFAYEEGEDILLEADAFDLQDDWLPDDKLEWISNIGNKSGNTVIGKGSDLIADDLKPGIHTITVRATNKSGKSTVSKAILLSVGNQLNAPVLTVSVSGTTASASWTSIPNAKYKFYYKFDLNSDYTIVDVGNLTSIPSVVLPEGMIVYIAVQAYNNTALSNLSNLGYISIPVSSLNIGNVGSDLKISLPCAQYLGNQYQFDMNYSSADALRWNMNLSSFKQIQESSTACLAVGNDLKLKLKAGYAGSTYSFTLNYDPTYQAAPLSWKMDLSSWKTE